MVVSFVAQCAHFPGDCCMRSKSYLAQYHTVIQESNTICDALAEWNAWLYLQAPLTSVKSWFCILKSLMLFLSLICIGSIGTSPTFWWKFWEVLFLLQVIWFLTQRHTVRSICLYLVHAYACCWWQSVLLFLKLAGDLVGLHDYSWHWEIVECWLPALLSWVTGHSGSDGMSVSVLRQKESRKVKVSFQWTQGKRLY